MADCGATESLSGCICAGNWHKRLKEYIDDHALLFELAITVLHAEVSKGCPKGEVRGAALLPNLAADVRSRAKRLVLPQTCKQASAALASSALVSIASMFVAWTLYSHEAPWTQVSSLCAE